MSDVCSAGYAQRYFLSHQGERGREYYESYWNHILIDRVINASSPVGSHLLEEGGGTCGIWSDLSFKKYTSVDISAEMIKSAGILHKGSDNKTFILGDIFSKELVVGAYSAIIANAYGIYYRPDFESLRRFCNLLSPGGILFVAVDPAQDIKHFLAAPFSRMIDKKLRRYTRVIIPLFEKMIKKAGFRVWLSVTYTPSPGWSRKAYILIKD